MKTIVLTVKDTAVHHVLAVLKRQLSADEVVIHPPTPVEQLDLSQNDSNFHQKLMEWREENQALLSDDDPWKDVRSKELGRDFNWED